MLRLPGPVVNVALLGARLLDRWGLLPKSMIEADPLFASCFIANLGSIDYPAGFHHLWEYGTCSAFAVMGKIEERADGTRFMEVKYSYDERVEDGLYAAKTMEIIKGYVENPSKL